MMVGGCEQLQQPNDSTIFSMNKIKKKYSGEKIYWLSLLPVMLLLFEEGWKIYIQMHQFINE